MRTYINRTICFTALLLLSFAIGCADHDRDANAGKPTDPLSPPTVTLVTPPDGSTVTCPNNPTVSATFFKAMNPATINTSTFALSGPSGANVAGKVTYEPISNVATFTPTNSLTPNTKFTAMITTGVADTFGNTMQSNFIWTFTTSPACIAPVVTVVTPPTGSVVLCPYSAIVSATFSKAMNAATINTSTFKLSGPGGASVAGTVSYNAATFVATFTPTSALAITTAYSATITTGVTDVAGNALASDFNWTFTTPVNCATAPPSVTIVTPPNGSASTCPNSAIVSATFSRAMNATTINTSTFTLSGPGGASVAGAVTYVAATDIATFTPSAALLPSTKYTATITTGAADTAGDTLAANFVWTFTTSVSCTPPPPLPLGSACSFGILGGSTVTNVTGTATSVSGDVGVWPGSAITGFGPPASITGVLHAGDAVAQTAQGDLTTAYNNAAGAAGGAVLTADIGGQTLPPGVYRTTSAQPSLGITGNLTLDGKGDPNATWIFQVVTTLTTAAGNSKVILIGNAQSKNVLWQIGSSATLGTNTIFEGTIMAQASVTATTGAVLNGRALARTGAVTLDTTTVVVPPCQ
jgi:hypothetical protein